MNNYNKRWTREKFLEYRKLKKGGYTHEMLIEHFGEDIYYSGLYNKNAPTLPNVLKYVNFINEIKVNPEKTKYTELTTISILNQNKNDYLLTFTSNGVIYVIYLMYFKIHDIDTYNIVFTTEYQWREYQKKLTEFTKKGYVEKKEFDILDNIIGKETKLNDLFPIIRKLSWILLDFYNKKLNGKLLSIGETKNEKKINLYRNIVKNSFDNIKEKETTFNDDKYFIYKIK